MLLRAAVLVLIALGLSEIKVTQLSSLLGGGAALRGGDRPGQLGEHGHDRQGPAAIRDRPRARSNQILDELSPDDQVALLLTGGPPFAEQGQLDSLPRCLPPHVQPVLRQQPAGRSGACASSRPARCWPTAERPQQADLRDHRHAKALAGTGLKNAAGGDRRRVQREPPSQDATPAVPHPRRHRRLRPRARSRTPRSRTWSWRPRCRSPECRSRRPSRCSTPAPAPSSGWSSCTSTTSRSGTSPVLNIEPDGREDARLPVHLRRAAGCTAARPGWWAQDGSPLDDRRFFTMEVDQGIPVAIVTPQRHEIPYLDDSFYVQQALMPAKLRQLGDPRRRC